jgi:uncharacterized protein
MSDPQPAAQRRATREPSLLVDEPQRRPRVWPLWLAYGSVWLFQLLVAFVLAGIAARLFIARAGRGPTPEELQAAFSALTSRLDVVLLSALFIGLFLVGLSLLGAKLSPEPIRERLCLGRPAFAARRPVRGYLVATALIIALGLATTTALRLLFGEVSAGLEQLDALLVQAPLSVFVLLVLLIAVLAPLAEELFFRGYIQTRLVQRYGRWPAIVVSSLLFGVLHVAPMHTVFAAVLGLGLGWITVVTGSVRPAILAHAANNLLAVLGARLGAGEPTGAPGVTLLLAVLVLTFVAALSLRRACAAAAPLADLERERHSGSLPAPRSSIRGT